MRLLFPPMFDEPEKGMPFAVLAYWIFAFVVVPTFIPIFGMDFDDTWLVGSWLDFIYHLLNALVPVVMLRTYLSDSFLNVQLYPQRFFATVGAAIAAMVGVMLLITLDFGEWQLNYYPINEISIAVTSGAMIQTIPLFGVLCHTLFAPFTITCLFYTVGFAPLCCRRTWLGYVVIPLVLCIPLVLDVLWRQNVEHSVYTYFLQLPIHLIACWSYQKADTVWAPITSLAAFNLITSLICVAHL